MMMTKIPSENPYAASEKLMWMHHHLPEIEDHIIITPDKGCVGSSKDFLVDDFPEWANAHNFPGTVIQFGGVRKTFIDKSIAHESDWEKLVIRFEKHSEKIK